MHAFVLELTQKSYLGEDQAAFLKRYYETRSQRPVTVTLFPDGKTFRVVIANDEKGNFNWCFNVDEHFEMAVFEVPLQNLTIPTADGRIASVGKRLIQMYPDAIHTTCPVVVDDTARSILIRVPITKHSPLDDHRRAVWHLVHTFENMARLTKRAMHLAAAAEKGDLGFIGRARRSLFKEIAQSGRLLVSRETDV